MENSGFYFVADVAVSGTVACQYTSILSYYRSRTNKDFNSS